MEKQRWIKYLKDELTKLDHKIQVHREEIDELLTLESALRDAIAAVERERPR